MKFPYYSLAILVILYHISIGICMMLNFHQLEDKRLKDILDTASLIFAIPSCRIDFPNFSENEIFLILQCKNNCGNHAIFDL